jgi:predicted DsbA family dithiol-disulfide isomerase
MIIDVWSDVVCPWCFIGKRRLEKALSNFVHKDKVTVRHRAFQLEPSINQTLPTSLMLAEKYKVDAEQVKAMQENVCSIADGEGLCYNLENTLSGNTFDAHRLLLWSASLDKQDELLEAMYSSYFEKERPLFSHSDLVLVATGVGIDADKVEEILTSDKFSDEVIADRNLAAQLGATGVPFFVFDMKFGLSGAQPLEAFNKTLENAWSEHDKIN